MLIVQHGYNKGIHGRKMLFKLSLHINFHMPAPVVRVALRVAALTSSVGLHWPVVADHTDMRQSPGAIDRVCRFLQFEIQIENRYG